MFDYVIDGTPAADYPAIWSRSPLQPIASDILTPFSFSLLDEIVGRAWYQYFDRLGFEPTPRARVMQQVDGRPYVNLALFAGLDALHAGLEPLTLRINNRLRPIAAWEKPGLLASFKTGRGQKKIDDLLSSLPGELESISAKVRQWYDRTQELKWSQAEVLQIMEEIVRVGSGPMLAYLAARYNLEVALNSLVRATLDAKPFPQNLAYINAALSDLTDLNEFQMAAQLAELSKNVRDGGKVAAWLQRDQFGDWRTDLPEPELVQGLEEFLNRFGHRASSEGEIRNPRWREDATPVLRSLRACLRQDLRSPVAVAVAQDTQKLLELVDPKQRKATQQTLQRMRGLLLLQSRALDAFGYVLAGTRRWVQAAAHEAMADGRLSAFDDVFFFELEEIKQMMTGEWNISDREGIQATAARRRAEHTRWNQATPRDLYLGDRAARCVHPGLPGVGGRAAGLLHRAEAGANDGCQTGIVASIHLGSLGALSLPVAQGFVAASGSPIDPLVVAARPWRTPIVVALGEAYDALVDGAHTRVDGENAQVDQPDAQRL